METFGFSPTLWCFQRLFDARRVPALPFIFPAASVKRRFAVFSTSTQLVEEFALIAPAGIAQAAGYFRENETNRGPGTGQVVVIRWEELRRFMRRQA